MSSQKNSIDYNSLSFLQTYESTIKYGAKFHVCVSLIKMKIQVSVDIK